MRRPAVLSLLLLVACGTTASPVARSSGSPSGNSTQVAAPSPTATAAGTASPSASASASASPSASPSAAPANFWLLPQSPAQSAPAGECNLPVYFFTQNGTVMTIGFYTYPSGLMPAANTTTIKAPNSPYYFIGVTYDRAVSKWMPAPRKAISPDGLAVAYAEYDLPNPSFGMAGEQPPHLAGPLATTGRVHVVDARTGADKILYSGSPTYSVVGFTSDGIYLAQVVLTMDGAFASGLFLLSPAGGSPKPVPGGIRPLDRGGWAVMNDAAWGTDFTTGGSPAAGDRLLRLDPKTGAVQEWMSRPEGVGVSLIGLDSNQNPLVAVYQAFYTSSGQPPQSMQGYEVWAMSAPGIGKLVLKNTDPSAAGPHGPSFTDSNGVWLSGAPPASVWLYTAQSGLRAIPVPAGQSQVVVAGTCA